MRNFECTLQYEPLPDWSEAEIRDVINRGDARELLYVPLVVSMNPPSRVYAEQVCLRFATHDDPSVRGNAMEGFGHIARLFRSLNKRLIEPVIEAGMRDPDDWVRGKAQDAADDIEWFCGWVFRGREERRMQPVCPRIDEYRD
jgi:hypothetical protein